MGLRREGRLIFSWNGDMSWRKSLFPSELGEGRKSAEKADLETRSGRRKSVDSWVGDGLGRNQTRADVWNVRMLLMVAVKISFYFHNSRSSDFRLHFLLLKSTSSPPIRHGLRKS